MFSPLSASVCTIVAATLAPVVTFVSVNNQLADGASKSSTVISAVLLPSIPLNNLPYTVYPNVNSVISYPLVVSVQFSSVIPPI